MSAWFQEQQTPTTQLRVAYERLLARERSRYQEVALYQTAAFGRVLTLDDVIMTTEADEFAYHELLVHPALLACPHPRSVLVVGGGDGGAVREVLRHPEVEAVTVAELDPVVVRLCRQHLPWAERAFGDRRVHLAFGDASEFVRRQPSGSFDAVLVDAPDPVGHASVLFSPAFYQDCRRVLRAGGVLAAQSDSPYTMPEVTRRVFGQLRELFPVVRVCWSVVPTYAGSLWTFTLGSLGEDPARQPPPERVGPLLNCRYWTPELHRAAFILPAFVQRRLLDPHAPHLPHYQGTRAERMRAAKSSSTAPGMT